MQSITQSIVVRSFNHSIYNNHREWCCKLGLLQLKCSVPLVLLRDWSHLAISDKSEPNFQILKDTETHFIKPHITFSRELQNFSNSSGDIFSCVVSSSWLLDTLCWYTSSGLGFRLFWQRAFCEIQMLSNTRCKMKWDLENIFLGFWIFVYFIVVCDWSDAEHIDEVILIPRSGMSIDHTPSTFGQTLILRLMQLSSKSIQNTYLILRQIIVRCLEVLDCASASSIVDGVHHIRR